MWLSNKQVVFPMIVYFNHLGNKFGDLFISANKFNAWMIHCGVWFGTVSQLAFNLDQITIHIHSHHWNTPGFDRISCFKQYSSSADVNGPAQSLKDPPAGFINCDMRNQIDCIHQVDPASVLLEGVAPLRWAYVDTTTPFEPFLGKQDCNEDCDELCPDEILDLAFNFDRQ